MKTSVIPITNTLLSETVSWNTELDIISAAYAINMPKKLTMICTTKKQ